MNSSNDNISSVEFELSERSQWLERLFVLSVACILFLTAVIKMLSMHEPLPLLSAQNPLFWYFNNGQVILLATIFEAATVAAILLSKNRVFRLGVILWLGTLFLAYRFGLWWIHTNTPCWCLGNIAGWLGFTPSQADTISKVILVYLIGGSIGFLIAMIRRPSAKGMRAKELP